MNVNHNLILALMCALLLVTLCSCASGTKTDDGKTAAVTSAPTAAPTAEPADRLLYKVSNMDYTLYMNIYYNDMGSTYAGTKMTTTGTFSTINDRFCGHERYYVWGYLDETKCCDWQWELSLPEGFERPADGSLVKVTGILTADENSLDGYWLTGVTMQVEQAHTPSNMDVDMSCMNATLERVQLMNMFYYPEDFAGQKTRIYGRVNSMNTIQHPYYDEVWEMMFLTGDTVPAIGTTVLVEGVYQDGILTDAAVQPTQQYY